MKNELLLIPAVILIIGGFIFLKGFQSNLSLIDILTIFILSIIFLIGSSLVCASLIISIDKIFDYFIK